MWEKCSCYLQLLRKFTRIRGYNGYYIGKVIYEEKGACPWPQQEQPRIVKQTDGYAVMEAWEGTKTKGIYIRMYLMRPVGETKKMEKCRKIQQECKDRQCKMVSFSQEEIQAFVTDTGDTNPIHQGEHPCVPGFLILKWLLQNGMAAQGRVQIRYRSPLYAQETAVLWFDETKERWYGQTQTDGRLLFTVKKEVKP